MNAPHGAADGAFSPDDSLPTMTPGGRAAPFPPAPALGFLDDRTEGSMRTARGGGADSSGEPALGRIDQYDLVRKLGGGGFGVVYLARDTVSGVRVALKTLHPLLKTNPEEMEALREKFALVARLTHQNVAKALVLHPCRMIDVWDETAKRELCLSSGDFVMVMDFAPGVTLTKWRRQFPGGRVPLSLALDVARQIAAALDYAHGEKIVHRDVKPGNVMVETVAAGPRPPDHGQGRARTTGAPTLRVRLLDFGLAAEIRSSMSRVSTESGHTAGTRPYMAPEQWLGRKQDGRTDQYALACVLYEMLSGAPPFAGVFETGDPVIMRTAVTTDPPEEIEGVPAHVNAALLRALTKDPKERFGSCLEFVENCLAQRPQGGGGLQTAVSKQGEAGSPGVLAPPDAPAQEAEVLRRKVLMARTLKSLPAEDRSDAGLSAFAEEADMELETAEEAFRYARFAAAAQCLDRADAALRKLDQAKAERKAREEAERRAREEAERRAREEAERKAREEAERKAREEAERKAREEAERRAHEEARRKACEEAERKAREEAVRRAREEAERKAREEAERKAREEAERMAREENQERFIKERAERELQKIFERARQKADEIRFRIQQEKSEEDTDRLGRHGLLGDFFSSIGVSFIGGCVLIFFSIFASVFACLIIQSDLIQVDDGNQESIKRIVVSVGSIEVALRWCPPGSFLMGSPLSENDRDDDEFQHRVKLTKGFWMGETEVTQGLWKEVMKHNPSVHDAGDNYPVENLSWDDCQEFIKRLNDRSDVQRTGFRFELPSEAQWEYACRAGTTGAYAGRLGRNLGWCAENSNGHIHPVAQKEANAWGLYDMHGNVWEWCADRYGAYPSGLVSDPDGPVTGTSRVLRGGGYCYVAKSCRSAFRGRSEPGNQKGCYGLRLLASKRQNAK